MGGMIAQRGTYLVDKDLGNGPLSVLLRDVGLDVGSVINLVQPAE
jgi:hypothetical protein